MKSPTIPQKKSPTISKKKLAKKKSTATKIDKFIKSCNEKVKKMSKVHDGLKQNIDGMEQTDDLKYVVFQYQSIYREIKTVAGSAIKNCTNMNDQYNAVVALEEDFEETREDVEKSAKHGAANFRINFLKKLGVTLRARLNDHTKNEVSKELLNKFMQDLKSQEEITSLNTEISRIKLENLQLRRKLISGNDNAKKIAHGNLYLSIDDIEIVTDKQQKMELMNDLTKKLQNALKENKESMIQMQEKLTDVQKKHEKEKNKSNRLRESKENALENFESLNKQLEDIKKKYDEEKYLSDRLKKSKENAIQNVVELNKQVGELNELKIQIEENAELLNQRQRNTINVLNSELDMKQIEIDETSIQLADAESKMNIYQKMIQELDRDFEQTKCDNKMMKTQKDEIDLLKIKYESAQERRGEMEKIDIDKIKKLEDLKKKYNELMKTQNNLKIKLESAEERCSEMEKINVEQIKEFEDLKKNYELLEEQTCRWFCCP